MQDATAAAEFCLQCAQSRKRTFVKCLIVNDLNLLRRHTICLCLGTVPPLQKKLMSQQQINDDFDKPSVVGGLGPEAMGIPVQFSDDLPLSLPIKIKPRIPMSNPIVPPAKSVTPTLFQIAARADDPESLVAYKNSLASGHARFDEKMLDAGKLEAVLNAAARRKKATPRRAPSLRLEKRLAINGAA
jgi:hypothetical protein